MIKWVKFRANSVLKVQGAGLPFIAILYSLLAVNLISVQYWQMSGRQDKKKTKPPLIKASYYHLIKAVSFCSEKGKHSSFYSQTYSQKITITTMTSSALCPSALRTNSGGRIQNCRKTRIKKKNSSSCGGCAWRHTRAHQTDYGRDGPAWTLFIPLPVSSLFDNFTWGKVSRPRQNNPSHTHWGE